MDSYNDLNPHYLQLLRELYDGLKNGTARETLSVLYGDDTIASIAGLSASIWRDEDTDEYRVTKEDLLFFVQAGFLIRLQSPQQFQEDFLVGTDRIRSALEIRQKAVLAAPSGIPAANGSTLTKPLIFICYSRADRQFVDIPRHIAANTSGWRQAIQSDGLPASTHMVVVLSPDSAASAEVESEWNWFLRREKSVYPLIHRDCEIPYRLENLQMYDLRKDYTRQLDRLVQVLTSEGNLQQSTGEQPQIRDPLTARVRRLINDGNYIELEDCIRGAVNETYQSFNASDFYKKRKALIDKAEATDHTRLVDCLSLYFDNCKECLAALLDVCWYGEERAAEMVEYAVGRWLEEPQGEERYVVWRYLPDLLLVYAIGIAALYRGKWAFLSAVFNQRMISPPGNHRRTTVIGSVVDKLFSFYDERIGNKRKEVPEALGTDIEDLLYPVFKSYHLSPQEYANLFNLFELLLAIYNFTRSDRSMVMLSLAHIPSPDQQSSDHIRNFWEHGGRQRGEWPFLKIGVFPSGPEELETLLSEFQKQFYQRYGFHYFLRDNGVPNYAGFYRQGLDSS